MYKLVENVLYNKDDELNQEFLMNIDDGGVYYLNPTAAKLVVFINEGKSLDEYVDYVYEATGKTVEKQVIESDALAYIKQLLEMNMLCEV